MQAVVDTDALVALRARRLRALRARWRADRRGRRGAQRPDRLRRREQPARPPGRREAARGARRSSTRPTTASTPGGLIQVADELEGFSFERAQQRASGIFDTTRSVFELARTDGVPPAIAADRLAERRMRDVGRCVVSGCPDLGAESAPLVPSRRSQHRVGAGTPEGAARRLGRSQSREGSMTSDHFSRTSGSTCSSLVAAVAVQLTGERPEVRLVSAVLQVASDLRLLGFGSAAPHRVSPLANRPGQRRRPDCP